VSVPVWPSKPGLFETVTFSVVESWPPWSAAVLPLVSVSVALTGVVRLHD
jgi:hypothetical protein